jgi:NRPS condensation-like uncharacterized protein
MRRDFFAAASAALPFPRTPATPRRLPRTRFGVVDELSCYYDTPAEPCTVHLEVRLLGPVDERALRIAVDAALAAHPRAMARRAAAGWWRPRHRWEQPLRPDVDAVAVTRWANDEELGQERARFLGSAPPLDSSPAVRVLLAMGPGEDHVILSAHHAALDGVSCLDLLRSISWHYGPGVPASAAQAVAELAEPNPAMPVPTAVARARPGPAGPASAAPTPAAAGRRLLGVLPRPAARITPVHDQEDDQRDGRPGYGFRLLVLPVPAVRLGGQEPHPTVNDLLITALAVAIARWNADHGRPDSRIRITMPINARLPDQRGAAGNLSRLATVTASPAAGGQGIRPLLADVSAQTRWAKDHAGPQVDPVSRALAVAPFPSAGKALLLRLALRTAGPLLCDTSLVSNLGNIADPPWFGQHAVTGMWFSTFVQMPRGLSVGAVTIGGQLHLCLRYRRALFSAAAADEFAAGYAAAVSDVTGDASGGA